LEKGPEKQAYNAQEKTGTSMEEECRPMRPNTARCRDAEKP